MLSFSFFTNKIIVHLHFQECSKIDQLHSKECEIPSWIDEDMIFQIQSITFKDIIGQGNFGVIRKALIKQGRAV